MLLTHHGPQRVKLLARKFTQGGWQCPCLEVPETGGLKERNKMDELKNLFLSFVFLKSVCQVNYLSLDLFTLYFQHQLNMFIYHGDVTYCKLFLFFIDTNLFSFANVTFVKN